MWVKYKFCVNKVGVGGHICGRVGGSHRRRYDCEQWFLLFDYECYAV